jgi:adenylate cyclase
VNGRPTDEQLEAAGLYDPSAPDAERRLALIDYLVSIGATLDDMVEAGVDALANVPTTITLWGENRNRLTLGEVVAESGCDPELIRRAWRAAGFPDSSPDERIFTRRDVELFGMLEIAATLLGTDVVVQLTRVIGASTARIADAAISSFVVTVGAERLQEDPSGLGLARANLESIALLDGLTAGFDTIMRHCIERSFRPIETDESRRGLDLQARTIGFADLVGSTMWTRQLELAELSRALTEFENRAQEIVLDFDGRLVKLIGDAIMFATTEPVSAVEIALALAEQFANDSVLPPVRVGLATGEVIARGGDYSGTVVNLAARATAVAEPSTVLADDATTKQLAGFECVEVGAFDLKGLDAPQRLFRIGGSPTARD